MDQAGELVKLCETYWQSLSKKSDVDLRAHAEKFMRYLGWDTAEPIDVAGAEVSVAVRGCEGTRLAVYFVRPGALDPPSRQVGRGLDYCPGTFDLVHEACTQALDYVLITDLYRSYLYDVSTDELLLFSDAPRLFLTEIYDEVTKECVDEGSLAELRRPPRSALARQLREWKARWSETILDEPGGSEALADHLMDRLCVLRFLLDGHVPHNAMPQLERRLEAVLQSSADGGPSAGQALMRLFGEVYSRFKAELFRPDPARDMPMESGTFVAPLMKELLLLSKAKFTIPTVLESFNYGEAAEKARVRIVSDGNAEREDYLAGQTPETVDDVRLEIDVLEEGYRSIGYWLDQLVGLYNRLNVEHTARQTHAARPAALEDPTRYAIDHGMTVFYMTERQCRTARLMLYLYCMRTMAQSGASLETFPRIECTLTERPALLESEKRWIYQPPPDHASRGWDVV